MENFPCPRTPIVALQTHPELWRCDKKLVLLSLKQQRSDGEFYIYIYIESLDKIAKGARAIAKASGLWQKAAGLAGRCGAYSLCLSLSLFFSHYSFTRTQIFRIIYQIIDDNLPVLPLNIRDGSCSTRSSFDFEPLAANGKMQRG